MTQFSKASMSRKSKLSLPLQSQNKEFSSKSSAPYRSLNKFLAVVILCILVGVLSRKVWTVEEEDAGFPPKIKDDEYETILHPATLYMEEDGKLKGEKKDDGMEVKVPKFWKADGIDDIRQFLGNYGERLMTPEEAAQVGSHVMVEGEGMMETIFISVASYRDYRCPRTVETVFKRARYPERIRVAIVDQIVQGEDDPCNQPFSPDDSDGSKKMTCKDNPNHLLCKYASNISYYAMDASSSVGPVFARHIGHRMYRGEYFAMQTDAHMEFIDGWDVDVIHQWQSTKNEMAVLSTYVSTVSEEHIDLQTGTSMTDSRPFMCSSIYEEDYYDGEMGHMRHDQQPEGNPHINGTPMLHPFWAAGFSFARGHFIVNVPYDQYLPMIFQGEEPNIGIRAFTYGYDIYAPERSVLFHYYSSDDDDSKEEKKKKNKVGTKVVKLFWENENKFENVAKYAMRRLKGIIQTNPEITPDQWNHREESKYGIGKVRTTDKYFYTFGIHPQTHSVEKNLCNFVEADMHINFSMALRDNKMGLDYNQISFQFKDELYPGSYFHDDAAETDDAAQTYYETETDEAADAAQTDDALSR